MGGSAGHPRALCIQLSPLWRTCQTAEQPPAPVFASPLLAGLDLFACDGETHSGGSRDVPLIAYQRGNPLSAAILSFPFSTLSRT